MANIEDFSCLHAGNLYREDTGELPDPLKKAFQQSESRSEAIVAALDRVLLALYPQGPNNPEMLFSAHFPGGEKAIPVFSSLAALQKIYSQARPLPINIREIAKASFVHGSGLLVLDFQLPTQLYIGRSAALALSAGIAWQPAWRDAKLQIRLQQDIGKAAVEISQLPEFFHGVQLREGRFGSCILQLNIVPGTPRAQVEELVKQATTVLSTPTYREVLLEPLEIMPVFSKDFYSEPINARKEP